MLKKNQFSLHVKTKRLNAAMDTDFLEDVMFK